MKNAKSNSGNYKGMHVLVRIRRYCMLKQIVRACGLEWKEGKCRRRIMPLPTGTYALVELLKMENDETLIFVNANACEL